ncbi:MAG: Ig-like domain-containing protein [Kiritimatiellia bacterium]
MKKMTFALACASTALLFADLSNAIGFEGYTAPFTGLSLMTDAGVDAGATSSFWLYSGAGGAVDGSTVKAYGGENLAKPTKPTKGDAGNNYLELSTEGGTLWRSANNLAGAESLGAAVEVPEGGLYIDTMVQFTPTEDGGAPEIGDDDKLAIWLNVSQDENDSSKSVTNLMVKAGTLKYEGGISQGESASFVLTSASGDLVVGAGTWHRLTVKTIQNIFDLYEYNPEDPLLITGFKIYLDGVELKCVTDANPFSSELIDWIESLEATSDTMSADISAGKIFPSLAVLPDSPEDVTLQAVGFKGSGAIDNLSISATAPEFGGDVAVESVTLDQQEASLTVGAELQLTATVNPDNATDKKVTWTTSAEGIATVVDGKVTAVAAGEATITATAGGKSATCTVTVTAPLDWDNPKTESGTAADMYGITGALATADGQKLAAWAKGNGSVSFDKAGDIILDAFLLNVANTEAAVNEAKPDFKIKSITVNADGTVTIEGPDGKYNGTVTIKGSATVDGEYKLPQDDAAARFFKAFLSL